MASHPERDMVSYKGFLMPRHQAGARASSLITQVVAPATQPAKDILVTGGKTSLKLNPKDIQGILRENNLRFRITENGTGNMYLAPVPKWFERVEWRIQGSKGNTVLKTEYGDTLFFENCALVEFNRQNHRDLNVSESYSRGRIHKQSTVRDYRVKLLSNPWVMQKADMFNLAGDIYLDITFNAGIVSSGSGVPSLTDVSLEIISESPSMSDVKIMRSHFSKPVLRRYLDVVKMQETGQTITASVPYTGFSLDALNGRDVAFLLVGIRADGYSNSAEGMLKLLSLHNGTIDVQTSNNQSILANSTTAVSADQLKHGVFSTMLDNKIFKNNRNWYVIPFCSDINQAFKGRKNSYLKFGKNYKLVITPPAAGTSAVQTITCNNAANDGGYYKLQYKGDSTSSLAFSASASVIQSALAALPSWLDYPGQPLTVTASGTLQASATLTFPSNIEPPNDHLVQAVAESLNDGTVAEFPVTTLSTVGVPGWTSGSGYTVDVYGFYHRMINTQGGKIAVFDSEADL